MKRKSPTLPNQAEPACCCPDGAKRYYMKLDSGTHLGPYEITIGAGRMGEVYKARDTRLPGELEKACA